MTGDTRIPFAALVLASWLGACQSSSGGRPSDSTAEGMGGAPREQASGPRVSAVRLERQPCFGTCPVYVLELDSTGRVQFEGRAHVRTMGMANATIGKDAFRVMTQKLVDAGFASFQSSYAAGTPECGDYATDLPVVILSAVLDGASKRVVLDYGCSGAPRALRRLHQMVDSVANTSRWLLNS